MRRPLLTISLLASLVAAVALMAAPQARPSVGTLRGQIQQAGRREHALAAGADGAAALISTLSGQLSVLGSRTAALAGQLARDRARLNVLSADAVRAHARVRRLRRQLVAERAALAEWLVAVYERGRPNTLEVLTSVHGFADLLERMDFLHRLSEHGGQITQRTSATRTAAGNGLAQVVALGAAQRQVTLAAATESSALQSISAALGQRRGALAQARQLQLAALSRTRSQRGTLQAQLAHELAAMAAARPPAPPPSAPTSAAAAGATTGFAIPWPIVQCESGGQNLPPNASGASGYYQILPATWKGAGGGTAQAYQAPKAEQDAVAARLWAGGAGASNWVCATLVRGG